MRDKELKERKRDEIRDKKLGEIKILAKRGKDL
jgi:hypothetical protein